MYDLSSDPGETSDLSKSQEGKFAELIRDYDDYTQEYGVLEMGINYEPLLEIQSKLQTRIVNAARPWLNAVILLLLVYLAWRRWRFI